MPTLEKPKSRKKLTPYQRFENLIRSLVAVPRKEIEAEQARYREGRAEKKKSEGD